ncbi:MAG: hypothetical protein P4L71_04080 [Acetobacteraceae bacterium]|nr:hypothetical protein [Acetobacteraceae bacterium]
MGQIIHFPLPAPDYPARATDLDRVESILLIAIRWWVAATRAAEDPLPRLCQGLDMAGAHDAAFSIDALMAVVARTARRMLVVHCPRCPHLSDDETQLLHAASLAQDGDGPAAERALRQALLSAQGAEFALGPLEGLSTLFTEASLLLLRRRPRPADPSRIPWAESWHPAATPDTLH